MPILTGYLGHNNHFQKPLPKQNEELMADWFAATDPNTKNSIKQKLVESNMKLVFKIAGEYYSNISMNDLVQEGAYGMLKGIESGKYNPNKSLFSTWIVKWIRAYILKAIIGNYSLIKMGGTKSERKLFWRYRKARRNMEKQGLPTDNEKIANLLGITKQEAEEFEIRLSGELQDSALEDMSNNYESSADKMIEQAQKSQNINKKIAAFKKSLNDKQKFVFEKRFGSDSQTTLEDIGSMLGVSKQRIKQIEDEIKIKISKSLKDFKS